jgi:hypothetical protein
LLHHTILRLIEHLQSLNRDDLAGIALDLYTDLKAASDLEADFRTHFYFLKV